MAADEANSIAALRLPDAPRVRQGAGFGQIAAILVITYLVFRFFWIAIFFEKYGTTPFDEIVAGLLFVPAALGLFKYWKNLRAILLIFAAYGLVAIFSQQFAGITGVQQPLAAIVDVVTDAKIFIFYLGFYYLMRSRGYNPDVFVRVGYALVLLAALNSLFVLRDVFIGHGVGLYGQRLIPRGGFYQPQGLVFHHLESCYVSMLGAFAALALYKLRGGAIWLAAAVGLSLIFFLHMSAKEMLAFLVCLFLYFIGRPGTTPVWIIATPFVLVALVGITLFTPIGEIFLTQWNSYLGVGAGNQVRFVLTESSFQIASQYFPFGSGGGTFASPPSVNLGYSDLYVRYGLYNIWGGSPQNPIYLLDVFWPKIIAETGWLGFTLFIAILTIIAVPVVRWFLLTRGPVAWFCLAVNLSVAIMSVASVPYNSEYVSIVWAFSAALAAVAFIEQFGRNAPRVVRSTRRSS